MSNSKTNSYGYTLLEMMVSTAIFTVILLLCAVTIVRIGQIYYKGTTTNRTQDISRKVADDIIQSIQFGAKSYAFDTQAGVAGHVEARCLGTVRYTYITTSSLGTASGQYRHILWKDRLGASDACATGLPDLTKDIPSPNGEELLGNNMRLPVFTVTDPSGSSNVYTVSIVVAYGATDDVFGTAPGPVTDYTKCSTNRTDSEFCAVSALTGNVVKRL